MDIKKRNIIFRCKKFNLDDNLNLNSDTLRALVTQYPHHYKSICNKLNNILEFNIQDKIIYEMTDL